MKNGAQLGNRELVEAFVNENTDMFEWMLAVSYTHLDVYKRQGPNHAVALEGALKIAETTGHAATAYEMEEFLHGPSIETNAERTVIIVDSLGQPSDRAVKMYESVHELTSRVYLITNRKIDYPKVLSINHHLDEHFSVLFNVIPFQVISAMGRDKWVNPLDEARKRMNDIMGSKAPKTGNEVGL